MPTNDSGHFGAGVARRSRRLWTDEEKRPIYLQTAAPGASVARVALRYPLNANLISMRLHDPSIGPTPARRKVVSESTVPPFAGPIPRLAIVGLNRNCYPWISV